MEVHLDMDGVTGVETNWEVALEEEADGTSGCWYTTKG
jgi:hypothetical protein